MTRWLTSDLHIGHANIVTYCDRPYADVDEMNADLVRRWNERVASGDVVYILGDLALGKLEESLAIVGTLNGTKILVPGNHDRMFRCQGTKWTNVCKRYISAGVDSIAGEQIELVIGGHQTLACHFPYAGDSKDGHEDRFADHRPKGNGRLVHGHTHGKWRCNGNMVDVGVDAWGGYPVRFAEVAELFDAKEANAEPLEWTP